MDNNKEEEEERPGKDWLELVILKSMLFVWVLNINCWNNLLLLSGHLARNCTSVLVCTPGPHRSVLGAARFLALQQLLFNWNFAKNV